MIPKILKEDTIYTFEKLSCKEREKLSNATIILTGCAGFLGFYFLHFFFENRDQLNIKKVIGLDNFMLGHPKWINELQEDKRFVFYQFDIINDDLNMITGWEDVDYVIHMASIASPTFYRMYPLETVDANVSGLRRLLEAYKDKQLKGFLFFSTSEIYGDPDPKAVPTDEEYHGNVSATGPRACYDESKRFCETICMLYAEKYGMPIGVARPFNNYGPGMKLTDKRVPADFADNIRSGKDIVILSNGTPTRTFCYIADAIAGYLKIMLYGKYDYFNIGIENPEITITELAEIYKEKGTKVFGYQGEVIYKHSEEKHYLTNNPQRRCPRIDKAKSILNYSPTISVEAGVERFLKFISQAGEEHLIW